MTTPLLSPHAPMGFVQRFYMPLHAPPISRSWPGVSNSPGRSTGARIRQKHDVRSAVVVRGASVFQKVPRVPPAMRSVADRRFDDARCLFDSDHNNRMNGAMYLAGIAVECLLKAALLEKHRWLQRARDTAKLSDEDKTLHSLSYSHDLDGMLNRLPEVQDAMRRTQPDLLRRAKQVCAQWNIHVRYSTRGADKSDAEQFLGTVREIKQCLARQ